MVKQPGKIANKAKRAEVYQKYKAQKKQAKKKAKGERKKELEALGDAAPPKQVPRTIENTRASDETMVFECYMSSIYIRYIFAIDLTRCYDRL